MHFSNSPAEALELLSQEPFDIIVTDLRMPEINGVQLLQKVQEAYPQMARFILSGHGDTDLMVKSVGVAHQFMAKPCDGDLLRTAIGRALALSSLFKSENLQNIVKESTSLPTLPELYRELTTLLQSPNSTSERVAAVISKDISVSAKVLQLVNSAFFGLSRQVDSIAQAVMLLGSETINSIALAAQVFFEFDKHDVERFGIRQVYTHSIATGQLAARIAKAVTGGKKAADEAMLSGIVHDLGKLVLINNRPDGWEPLFLDKDRHMDVPFHEQERELLGISHAEVGAYLIGLWGISYPIVEAVAYHHTPSQATDTTGFCTLTALHLANHIPAPDRRHGIRS